MYSYTTDGACIGVTLSWQMRIIRYSSFWVRYSQTKRAYNLLLFAVKSLVLCLGELAGLSERNISLILWYVSSDNYKLQITFRNRTFELAFYSTPPYLSTLPVSVTVKSLGYNPSL